MKQLFFFLALMYGSGASAQMDDRFYFPSKNTQRLDSLQAETFMHVFDGDSVYSYLLKPAGPAKATVLYCHGAGGNVGGYLQYVEPLVKDGYQVYMIDFRGYGHSTGKPTHLNIAADGQKLFDHALGLDVVKNTK